METYVTHTEQAVFMSSNQPEWIAKLRLLAAHYPDQVTVLQTPQGTSGFICAKLPPDWLNIRRPRQTATPEDNTAEAEANT